MVSLTLYLLSVLRFCCISLLVQNLHAEYNYNNSITACCMVIVEHSSLDSCMQTHYPLLLIVWLSLSFYGMYFHSSKVPYRVTP